MTTASPASAWRGTVFMMAALSAVGAFLISICVSAPAEAAPPVDVVGTLTRAGVPADVAATAVTATPAAALDTVNIVNPRGGFLGNKIDARIDHPRGTVTVIQRYMENEKSQLSVAWVNLRNGRSGVSGFPNVVPSDQRPTGYPTTDRTAVLNTGAGPVLILVYGRVPSETSLIPLNPEAFGYLTPAPRVLTV